MTILLSMAREDRALLTKYALDRLGTIHTQLEMTTDFGAIRALQGRALEIRWLLEELKDKTVSQAGQ